MKKTKRMIVLVMACVMLFGSALTVQAEYVEPCNHSPSASYTYKTEGANCYKAGCYITWTITTRTVLCTKCQEILSTSDTKGEDKHSTSH